MSPRMNPRGDKIHNQAKHLPNLTKQNCYKKKNGSRLFIYAECYPNTWKENLEICNNVQEQAPIRSPPQSPWGKGEDNSSSIEARMDPLLSHGEQLPPSFFYILNVYNFCEFALLKF